MVKYYAGANSCSGYVDFLDENIRLCDSVIGVKNTTSSIRKDILGRVGERCCELIMKAGTNDDIDAIITDSGKVIVFSQDYDIVSYDFADPARVNHSEIEIVKYEIAVRKQKMFSHLACAKAIHDDWEKIYISNMDFIKAEETSEQAVANLICGEKRSGKGTNKKRFFGSMTPGITVNLIDNITDGFQKRVFIKGRPGTGKSTLLKHVRDTALDWGFDTETYRCSFDSNSLDMVVIRELSVCIFDSTAPHEMFPEKDTDEILDIYKIAVASDTDEKYADELNKLKKNYGAQMSLAKLQLTAAEEMRAEFERIVASSYDNKTTEELMAQIIESVV